MIFQHIVVLILSWYENAPYIAFPITLTTKQQSQHYFSPSQWIFKATLEKGRNYLGQHSYRCGLDPQKNLSTYLLPAPASGPYSKIKSVSFLPLEQLRYLKFCFRPAGQHSTLLKLGQLSIYKVSGVLSHLHSSSQSLPLRGQATLVSVGRWKMKFFLPFT